MEEGRRLLFFFHIFLAFSPTSSSRPRPPCSLHGRQKRGGRGRKGGYSRHFLIRSIITHMRKERRRGDGKGEEGGRGRGKRGKRVQESTTPSLPLVLLSRWVAYVRRTYCTTTTISSPSPPSPHLIFLMDTESHPERAGTRRPRSRERGKNCVNSLHLLSPRPVANYS